ncbi:endonuclease/exonuclease/phosphatase family protein [Salinibacterium sp.]|uniref:endonuclease/exonuclease/phosphatase family protein n=1 Tax=Salinibacterium sp. TaxID=1915057 RepID=UPI00286A32DB|nr:endonuclease/exonuclease/phosphatase family protein [Salinibacterium sp.]
MIRRTLAVSVALGIALAIVAWPQAIGLSRAPITAHVVSLRGLAIVAAVVVAVVLIVVATRSRRARVLASVAAVLLTLFGAANFAILASRGTAGSDGSPASTAGVTVLAWNTLGDAPGASVIAELAIAEGADIVSLPETTATVGRDVAALMAMAGMPMSTFTLAYDNNNPARSTTLLISTELGEYAVDETSRTTLVLPTVIATPTNGTGPTIAAVHTLAPLPPMMLAWQQDLQFVQALCTRDSVIVAGDFNATVDNFAGLGTDSGSTLGECSDAALSGHAAALGTWPTILPPALGSPIDHVLVTDDWVVTGVRVIETHDDFGSDHRPIVAHLAAVR